MAEVERVVIGRAARLADASACARFEELRGRFLRAAATDEHETFIAADRDFNGLIVATADNKYAAAMMAPIQAQTRRFWFLNFKKFGELDRVSAAHAEIAAAVAAKNEARARQASDALIDYVEEYSMRMLKALL